MNIKAFSITFVCLLAYFWAVTEYYNGRLPWEAVLIALLASIFASLAWKVEK